MTIFSLSLSLSLSLSRPKFIDVNIVTLKKKCEKKYTNKYYIHLNSTSYLHNIY